MCIYIVVLTTDYFLHNFSCNTVDLNTYHGRWHLEYLQDTSYHSSVSCHNINDDDRGSVGNCTAVIYVHNFYISLYI